MGARARRVPAWADAVSVPAGGADARRGVRGASPTGPLRAAAPRVLRAVRDGDAAAAFPE